MDDTLTCPVCGNRLRNIRLPNRYFQMLDKKANFIERTCTLGHNHALQFFTDEGTGEVDLLKISLTSQGTRFVEINYVLGISRISCLKNGETYYLEIEKVLEPDFPNLTKLKEKVGIFVVFS